MCPVLPGTRPTLRFSQGAPSSVQAGTWQAHHHSSLVWWPPPCPPPLRQNSCGTYESRNTGLPAAGTVLLLHMHGVRRIVTVCQGSPAGFPTPIKLEESKAAGCCGPVWRGTVAHQCGCPDQADQARLAAGPGSPAPPAAACAVHHIPHKHICTHTLFACSHATYIPHTCTYSTRHIHALTTHTLHSIDATYPTDVTSYTHTPHTHHAGTLHTMHSATHTQCTHTHHISHTSFELVSALSLFSPAADSSWTLLHI